MWTGALTRVLLQAIEDCIDMLRSRADKYKAWKIIAGSVNAHVRRGGEEAGKCSSCAGERERERGKVAVKWWGELGGGRRLTR